MSKVKCQLSHVKCCQSGYIALISAIVISILLLAITVGLGFSGFFTRFNILDSESKERSLALAEACIDTARLNIMQDPLYNPSNEIVTVGTDQCVIISALSTAGGTATAIRTQAIINKSFSNLMAVVNNDTFEIISWEECAVGPCP